MNGLLTVGGVASRGERGFKFTVGTVVCIVNLHQEMRERMWLTVKRRAWKCESAECSGSPNHQCEPLFRVPCGFAATDQ